MAIDSVDEYGRTAIMYSAMTDREECVEFLVKRGASLNIQASCAYYDVHMEASSTGLGTMVVEYVSVS